MTNDVLYALGLIGLFLAIFLSKTFAYGILDVLSILSRPGATVLLLVGVGVLYCKKLPLSSIIAAILSVYVIKSLWSSFPESDTRRLNLEVGRDLARFEPANSIDLQFANGTAKHDLPHLLVKTEFEDLLVFPPSSQTLHDMNGD